MIRCQAILYPRIVWESSEFEYRRKKQQQLHFSASSICQWNYVDWAKTEQCQFEDSGAEKKLSFDNLMEDVKAKFVGKVNYQDSDAKIEIHQLFFE